MMRMPRNPRVAYELMDIDQLKRLREAFEYDLAHHVRTEEAKLFANTRIAIIDKILEEREVHRVVSQKEASKKELKPPRRLREIVRSCATCEMLLLHLPSIVKCKRPGGPMWSDSPHALPSQYVCDRWRRVKDESD